MLFPSCVCACVCVFSHVGLVNICSSKENLGFLSVCLLLLPFSSQTLCCFPTNLKRICLHSPNHHRSTRITDTSDFLWVVGIQTQVLTPTWQMSYSLSHDRAMVSFLKDIVPSHFLTISPQTGAFCFSNFAHVYPVTYFIYMVSWQ